MRSYAKSGTEMQMALIDEALATLRPGDTMVQCGDFALPVETVRAIRQQLADGGTAPAVHYLTPRLWPGGIVRYRFDPNFPVTDSMRRQFYDSVTEWAAFGALQFVELAPIDPTPANYITVQANPAATSGRSSEIGMGNGEQFIVLPPSQWTRWLICHEMGHALGFLHEHCRADRDTYVTVMLDNIESGQAGNFMILPNTVSDGAYDFLSVMHYSQSSFARQPGLDTLLPTTPYDAFKDRMGQTYDRILSKSDRAAIATLYGPPALTPSAVVSNSSDSGPGTLRAALYYALDRSTDAVPTATSIVFRLPTTDPSFQNGTFYLAPSYELTTPGDHTTIDGATQTAFTGDTNPAGPEIMLDGRVAAALGQTASGLYLRATGCEIRNLCIGNFPADGIRISKVENIFAAATMPIPSQNLVTGCYLGVYPDGLTPAPNGHNGITLDEYAAENTVGGTQKADANVISGNMQYGLGFGHTVASNVVIGNGIGLDAGGNSAVPNAAGGVVFFGGAENNSLGGTAPGTRNFIAGNLLSGILIRQYAGLNSIAGNSIGLTRSGRVVGNGPQGIRIQESATKNQISRNTITGYLNEGVAVYDVGTLQNSIQANSIYAVGGRPIHLYDGSNESLAAPTVTACSISPSDNINGTNITVSASGPPFVQVIIEAFAGSSALGGTAHYLGKLQTSLGAAGAATVTLKPTVVVPAGYLVTATVTTTNLDTSEYSASRLQAVTDTDHDGLPDAWETSRGLNPNDPSDALADSDGDGASNLEEYFAGTDPRLNTSRLRFTVFENLGQDLHLRFPSLPNRVYRLESRTGFSPSTPWELMLDGLSTVTNSSIDLTISGALRERQRFFRVVPSVQ